MNIFSYLCTNLEQMKRLTLLFCILFVALGASKAQRKEGAISSVAMQGGGQADTSQVVKRYLSALESLVKERDSLNNVTPQTTPNAYYFQILTQPTLYESPLHQMMSRADSTTADPQLQRLFSTRKMLSSLYTRTPWLVTQTESDLRGQSAIRSDVNDKLNSHDKLAEKIVDATLTPTMDEPVEVITRRPNFWRFSGSSSVQFSQNYFSSNWYKGGESNQSGFVTLTLNAKYNDQRKISWDNTLDAQLGFQTTESDKVHSFRPTNNLLRYTTNAGYRAWKSLYYSLQVILQTQIVPNYQSNKDVMISKIFSPLEVTIAPGMKYEIAWGKKKQFTGTLNVAPLAMKILYVGADTLVTNFGLEKGHHSRTTFGPNITLNTRWQICKQIAWSSRVYWMTNFDYNIWEWENTIEFSVTKLITARMYLYPRFDNSNERYRSGENHDGTYMMFKEWLSLGLTYNF